MPPLDWSIIQSVILHLILPGFGIAAAGLAISFALTRSDRLRHSAASLSLIAGFTAGNFLGKILSFEEFETGWRSLFWVTVAAIAVDTLIGIVRHRWFGITASIVLATVSGVLLTPWVTMSSLPVVGCVLVLTILLDWTTLSFIAEQRHGHFVPLLVSSIWGGTVTAILALSHSTRFAELSLLFSFALSGIGLVSAITKERFNNILAGPAVFFPAVMLSAALNTYSNVPNTSFALAAISPGLLVFLRFKAIAAWFDSHPKTLVFVSTIPCVIAVGIAIRAES